MWLLTPQQTVAVVLAILVAVVVWLVCCRPCPEQALETTMPTAEPAEPSVPRGPPLIGITGYVVEPAATAGSTLGAYRMTRTYRDAVVRAGGHPVHLVPVPLPEVGRLLDRLDGLVLSGGADIDPELYGEDQHPTVSLLPPERQEFDLALAREAMHRRIPTLGICLGSQELNVAHGGSMIQDIPSEVEGDVGHRRVEPEQMHRGAHEIAIVEGTLLERLYGRTSISVNSLHHQASDVLGEGLVVAARAPDGVIEAFYRPDHPFLVGVQYHPELQDDPPGLHDGLFRAFMEAAAAYRDRSAE